MFIHLQSLKILPGLSLVNDMRLIDADALIKQFEWLELCRLSKNEIYQIIHESPTVAVNCKDCDGYEAGYSAGLKDAERPRGK